MESRFKSGVFFVADRGLQNSGELECFVSGPHTDSKAANQIRRAYKLAGMTGATVLFYPLIQGTKQDAKDYQ